MAKFDTFVNISTGTVTFSSSQVVLRFYLGTHKGRVHIIFMTGRQV